MSHRSGTVCAVDGAMTPAERQEGRERQDGNAAHSIVTQLIGTWDLVEWLERRADGTVTYPLGEGARGQLLYSTDGHVAAQLVRADRVRFESDDWRGASGADAGRAFKEYFGYFGTYSIDLQRHAVVHHVDGAWFPNVEGSDQLRRFRFAGGQLVLDADTEWGKVRIIWRRATVWNPEESNAQLDRISDRR